MNSLGIDFSFRYEIKLVAYYGSIHWVGTDVQRSVVDGITRVTFIDCETGKRIEFTGTIVIIKEIN